VKYVQLGKPNLVGKHFKKAAKLKPYAWEIWFVKAGWAIEQQSYEAALRYLNQAQQKNPASVDIALAMGFVQIQLEDYVGALDVFGEVLDENPENLIALDGLGIVHYYQQNYYSVAQLAQNISALDTLHQLDEGAYLAFAIGCYQTGFYSRADSLISKVFFKNPKSAEAFALRGLWNYKKEHYQIALDNFSAAIQLEKKNRSLYNARGNTHFFLGQYGEAIDDFDKVLAAEPQNLEALNGKALCYADLDKYEMATLWYEKALAYYPAEGKLWNNYSVSLTQEGGYFIENGDTSKAKRCFEKSHQAIQTARSLRPLWKPWCDLNEGNIFHEAGNDSLALLYYAANENAYSLNNTGVVLALHQVYDQAWGYFGLAIQADSTYGVPYTNRARLNEFYSPAAGATDKTDRQIAQHLNHLDKRQSPFHRKKYYTIYVFDMDIGYVPDPQPEMYFPPLQIDLLMSWVRVEFVPVALDDYRIPAKIKTFRKPGAKFKSQRYNGFKCPVALKK
jgi:tetratricopeptide (TPR) repeat protein